MAIVMNLEEDNVGCVLLGDIGRVTYTAINDKEALSAFHSLCLYEGIIPALESAHALAQAIINAKRLGKGKNIIVCLSGRGDKDMDNIVNYEAKMQEKKQ